MQGYPSRAACHPMPVRFRTTSLHGAPVHLEVAVLLALALVCLSASAAGANLLVNPGFESSSPEGGWPDDCGYWGGDLCYFVGAEQGIVPPEGTRMLSFIAAAASGPSSYEACQVHQLVDLAPFMPVVRSGVAVATATALCNRVSGDSETDTQFYMILRACTGAVPDFHPNTYIASAIGGVYSDADPGTWELVTVELIIPAEADYLSIGINAHEDVHNDLNHPEFDGHYCDVTSLVIDEWATVPEGAPIPSTWTRIKALLGQR